MLNGRYKGILVRGFEEGGYQLTYTGLLVFGKQMSLRRLVPSFRVDYIRISGNQWMADGNHRFEQTIDMRGPLMLMVNKACCRHHLRVSYTY